jgi:hypothetical protein
MKSRKQRPSVVGLSDAARQQQVQHEIQAFLKAIHSYPDRFARNPYLSFEQHFFSIAAVQPRTVESERRKP